MEITGAKLVVWIVGILAGSLTGLVVKRRKAGFGRLGNLGIGLAGAVIGGVVFSVLRIDLGTHIAISLHDILSAFVGALILLGVVAAIRKRGRSREATPHEGVWLRRAVQRPALGVLQRLDALVSG